jgi:maleylpyruvate isomerase
MIAMPSARSPSTPFRLAGFWRSLATYRVRIGLRLKGLAFEETSIDLLAGEQHRDDFVRRSPQHAVPVLDLGEGRFLTQSLAILEYLEEIAPTPSLWPDDAHDRALARQFALIAIADSHPLIVPRVRRQLTERFGADHAAVEDWARHWLTYGLRAMEARLAARQGGSATAFCFADRPGIADIALAAQCKGAELFSLPLDGCPLLRAAFERCMAEPAFTETAPLAIRDRSGAASA